MNLSKEDLKLFYTLHPALLFYTNQKKNIIKDVMTQDEFMELEVSDKSLVRDALYKDKENIINQFISEKRDEFSTSDLKIVDLWRHQKRGSFIILKQLKSYATLLSTDEKESKAYAVHALTDGFDEMFYLPMDCNII